MIDTATPDEATQVDMAVADLRDRFPQVGTDRIESTVRRLVHQWFERARVTTFVGIIAGRQARAELSAIDVEPERTLTRASGSDAHEWVTPRASADALPPPNTEAWVTAVRGNH